MIQVRHTIAIAVLLFLCSTAQSFVLKNRQSTGVLSKGCFSRVSLANDNDNDGEDASSLPSQQDPQQEQEHQHQQRDRLKRDLLQFGASYDRGFGVSPAARRRVDEIIHALEQLSPEESASQNIDGPSTDGSSSPLEGKWRMIWTSASDVLSLGASPFVSVGAIYQVFEPPVVTNVIDLIPRSQNLLPTTLVESVGSLLRAEVRTRASSRADNSNRVGLVFEKVALQPVSLLGQSIGDILPPLSFDLPQINAQQLLSQFTQDVGYFDVTYLDSEMLIIRQNAPGGLFALVRVDDASP